MKKTLLLLAIFVCCDLICQSSGDYRTKSSGTWSAASNWETYNGTSWVPASAAPTSTNGVITILNGHTMTVGSSVTLDQVVIEAGGQINCNAIMTLANGSGNELTIFGTFVQTSYVSRETTSYIPDVSIKNGGLYIHNRNFTYGILEVATNVYTGIWEDGSTCRITADPSTFNSSLSRNFFNLEFNWTTGTTARILEDNLPINVRGTFKVENTGTTGSLVLGNGSTGRSLTVSNFEITGGNFYLAGAGASNTHSITINGNFTQSGGGFEISRTDNSGTYSASIGGNLTLSGGITRVMNNSGEGGRVAALTIVGNTTISGGTLDLSATGATNAGRLFVKGNFIQSGGNLQMTSSASSGSSGFYFEGTGTQTVTFSGGTQTSTTNVLNRFYYKTTSGPTALNETYSGSSAQNTITGSAGNPAGAGSYAAWPTSGTLVKNVIFNNSAGVTLSNARTINTTLQLLSGTLNNATNNITMASGTTIEKTNGSLSAAPVFAGTVNLLYSENATGITNSGNEVPTSASVLNNVTLDNSNNVNLNSDMTINGIFDFNAGLLKCQNSKVLTFNQGSSHIGSGGLSYVVGKVSKIGNTAFTFPIGSDLLFRSASISAPSNSTDKFSAQYFRSNPTSLFGTGKDVTLNNVSKLEYWDVSRDIGTSSVSVSLDWESNTSGVTNPSDLRVSHWNSSLSKWEDLGKTNSITASSTSGFVTSNVTSNFSPFTLGSATAINPLPIELYDFDIFCYNNKLKFFWETKSEDNNHFYSILSSSDAINWSVIDTIKSKGNTSIGHQYEFLLDKKIDGKYFRLKQTDYDQKFELFPIKYFDSEMCLNYDHFIYYNQDKRTIIWNLVSDNYYFELIDYTGRVYLSGVTDLNYINTDKLNDGVYIFKLKVNGVHYIKKIVIKKL